MAKTSAYCYKFTVLPGRRRRASGALSDGVKSVVIIESEESRAMERLTAIFPRCTVLDVQRSEVTSGHVT